MSIKSYYVVRNKGHKVVEAVTTDKVIFNKYLIEKYGTLTPDNKVVEVVSTNQDLPEYRGHHIIVSNSGKFMFN